MGAWPASSDRPAPQRFLDQVKRFEGKTDAVLNQCHGLISGQQIKLAKVGSHLYVVKTLLDRRSASIAQKEAQIAEERLYMPGQVMMEEYYTVFDKAKKRVGFAPIAGCD